MLQEIQILEKIQTLQEILMMKTQTLETIMIKLLEVPLVGPVVPQVRPQMQPLVQHPTLIQQQMLRLPQMQPLMDKSLIQFCQSEDRELILGYRSGSKT